MDNWPAPPYIVFAHWSKKTSSVYILLCNFHVSIISEAGTKSKINVSHSFHTNIFVFSSYHCEMSLFHFLHCMKFLSRGSSSEGSKTTISSKSIPLHTSQIIHIKPQLFFDLNIHNKTRGLLRPIYYRIRTSFSAVASITPILVDTDIDRMLLSMVNRK